MTNKTWNAIIEVQQNLERLVSMDKEKILAAARCDKHRGEEFENKQYVRGSLLSAFFAILLGIILFFAEYFCQGTLNFGLIAVGATALGVQYLFEGITTKKVLTIIVGSIYSLLAALFTLAFIGQVVAA